MQIKLIKLQLENFKGIRKFTFEPEGKNASVLGTNATGKTTLADAFRWLPFGKDTQDKADFAIKTLAADGAEQSGLEHTVSALIEVDDTPLRLKRTYKEKWTKKRGDAKKTLTGHNTNYSIDGVPTIKKTWDSRLAGLIDEEQFKLITLPSYFNSLHWQKRREILLEVCGNISDESVIASDSDLYGLTKILEARSLDDHQKVIRAEKTKINDRLKEIPARIDELVKSLPEAKNRPAIEAFIALKDKQIEKAKDDSELAALRKELAEKQAELAEAQAAERVKHLEANEATEEKIAALKKQIREIELDDSLVNLETAKESIKINKNGMVQLRNAFAVESAKKAEYDEICPACTQPIPEDQIETVKAEFNTLQAERLAEINKDGKKLKALNAELTELVKDLENRIEIDRVKIGAHETVIDGLEPSPLPGGMNGLKEALANPEIKKLFNEVDDIQAKILDRPTTDTAELEAERREELAKLAALDAAEKTKGRIEDLKTEEKQLSIKFEELERQLFLMESFIKAKVGMLESKINNAFDIARFKLFNIQVNGVIEECCETLYEGIPYSRGLNTGAQTLVGCDIIKTLSEFYNIKAPLWQDHAESCLYDLKMDCQVIRLVVDGDCKEMKVEYE